MDDTKCPRCGDAHSIIACPLVKAIEFEHGGDLGSVRRIEFMTPADWPQTRVAATDEPASTYPRKGQQ